MILRIRISGLILLCAALLAPAAANAANPPINVQVVNNSAQTDDNVWLTLHNGSSADGQLVADTPVKLSSLTNNSFTLGDITAGRLFVSYGQGVGPAEPMGQPVRNDKIEFTNPGVVNLTSVDFYGIPIDVQTLDSNSNVLESLTFRCHTDTILPKLQAISGVTGAQINTAQGGFSRFLSPQISPPATYPQMTGYLASMAGKTITVNSTFFGSPLQTTNYTGTFGSDGSITLNGTLTTPSNKANPTVAGAPLAITGASLLGGVYSGNGSYTVGGAPAAVGDNNVYSVIYRDIAAGFALGYWGGKYGNASADWNRQPPFAAAWNTPPAFTPYFHQYAQIINQYSDSYGFSFSDVGPSQVQAGLNSGVSTMRVTIDSDSGPQAPGCSSADKPTTWTGKRMTRTGLNSSCSARRPRCSAPHSRWVQWLAAPP
ncbi:MAG: hypothetical protein JHD02_03580, partial [Thermoleophilaceae bacterium]|nr:hypothetical protein [Thermoleophilaceae bacterium]